MTERDYQRLVKQAALAYNLDSVDYQRIMDKACIGVDDWDKFLVDFEEAIKVPPTEGQKSQHAKREKQGEIEAAKRNLRVAQERLARAIE